MIRSGHRRDGLHITTKPNRNQTTHRLSKRSAPSGPCQSFVFCVCSMLFHGVGLALRARRTIHAGKQPRSALFSYAILYTQHTFGPTSEVGDVTASTDIGTADEEVEWDGLLCEPVLAEDVLLATEGVDRESW